MKRFFVELKIEVPDDWDRLKVGQHLLANRVSPMAMTVWNVFEEPQVLHIKMKEWIHDSNDPFFKDDNKRTKSTGEWTPEFRRLINATDTVTILMRDIKSDINWHREMQTAAVELLAANFHFTK